MMSLIDDEEAQELGWHHNANEVISIQEQKLQEIKRNIELDT